MVLNKVVNGDGKHEVIGFERPTWDGTCYDTGLTHVPMKVESIALSVIERETDVEVTALPEDMSVPLSKRDAEDLLDVFGAGGDMVQCLNLTVQPNGWHFALGDEEVRGLEALHCLKEMRNRDVLWTGHGKPYTGRSRGQTAPRRAVAGFYRMENFIAQ